MLRSLAKFSESEASNHAPSLADFITTMAGFKVFGTHRRFESLEGLEPRPWCCSLAIHRWTTGRVNVFHSCFYTTRGCRLEFCRRAPKW
jgi:hypothetical protein